MKNLQYYKRILAGVVCATMLLSNLGATTQVAFAAETSDAVTEDTGSEEIAVQEAPAEESAVSETPAEDTSYNSEEEISVESTEDEGIAPVSEEEEPVQEITETGSTGEESTEHSEDKTEESSTEATTEKEETKVEETKTVEESGSTASTEKSETTTEQKETSTEATTEQSEAASTETTEEKAEETKETEEESKAFEHSKDWYYTRDLTCEEEHEHTDDCYKVTKELSCKEDHEHTADCYKAIEETKEIEESGEAEVKTITYEVHTSGIKVTAEAKENALPDGAQLKAHRIKDESDLEKVTEELDNSDVDYDDYIALDVYFQTMYGEEIEPDGTVQVTFELEESTLNDINADSVSVQHFDESQDKTEVVTVADTTSNDSTGTVEVQNADNTDVDTAVKAEFEVQSFSTFTITWTRSNDSRKITVNAADEDGNVLAFSATPDGNVSSTMSVNYNTEVKIDTTNIELDEASSKYFSNNSTSDQLQIDGYVPISAELTYNGTTYSNVTSIKFTKSNNYYGSWTGTIKYDGGTETIKNVSSSADFQLNVRYRRIKATLSYSYTLSLCDRTYGNDTYVTVSSSETPPESQDLYYGSTVTLPDCKATATDSYGETYSFVGWYESSSFKLIQQYYNASGKVYQPGNSYIVNGDTTLYAVWSKTEDSGYGTARFFIRLDGNIPSRTHTDWDSQYYTGEITKGTYIKERRYIYDMSAGDVVDDGKRSYVENEITKALAYLPTNEEIYKQLLNEQSKFNYQVAYDTSTGKLSVSAVKDADGNWITSGTTTDGKMTVGDELYVYWYVQKYPDDNPNYPFNIDGVLLNKSKVAVFYNANCSGTVTNIPSGYQVAENTDIYVGVDGQAGTATSTITEPTRDGYKFLGWNTAPDGSGESCKSGAKYNVGTEDVTFYAIWAKTDDAGNLKTGNLKISMEVIGGNADPDAKYEVTVSVPEALIDGQSSYRAIIHYADGTQQEITLDFVDDNGNSALETVQLGNGDYILIENLPDGASYEINEANAPTGYRVSYKDANGDDVKEAKGTIVDAMTREIKVINKARIVKTGVELGGTPVEAIAAMIVIASMCGLVYWKGRRYVQ